MIEMVYRIQKVYEVDITANPVEQEEVENTKKNEVRLLFLQMKPNIIMKMPTTATMK